MQSFKRALAIVLSLIALSTVTLSFQNCAENASDESQVNEGSSTQFSRTLEEEQPLDEDNLNAFVLPSLQGEGERSFEADDLPGLCEISMAPILPAVKMASVSKRECARVCTENARTFRRPNLSCKHAGKQFFSRPSRASQQCRIKTQESGGSGTYHSLLDVNACVAACQGLEDEGAASLSCVHNLVFFKRDASGVVPVGSCTISRSIEGREFEVTIVRSLEPQCDNFCERIKSQVGIAETDESKWSCEFTELATPMVQPRAD